MALQPLSTGFLSRLFPGAGQALLALYASAAENAGLVATDFYTIRDLLQLSGYSGEEPLQVLLLSLTIALDEGSLCIEASEAGLSRRLGDLVDADQAADLAGRAVAALKENRFVQLIGQQVDEGKPVVRQRRGDRLYLYFQKYLKHEQILQTQLRRRLDGPVGSSNCSSVGRVLREVLQGATPSLNDEQRLAIAVALVRNFAIISGGPGTGKTSIVLTLLRCLVRLGVAPERIALAAPTGRAAQRLTDAVHAAPASEGQLRGLTASTLHQLLGYNPSRETFRHHVENPVQADVIIVDEVSMVGLTLMSQLLQATDLAAKLVFLGDKDQLPSVEAGAVLGSLVPSGVEPSYSKAMQAQLAEASPGLEFPAKSGGEQPLRDTLVVLETNYRSQPDIQEAARAVNRQDQSLAERLPLVDLPPSFEELEKRQGCWLLDLAGLSVTQWRQVLLLWLEHHYLAAVSGTASYRGLTEECVLPSAGETAAEQQASLRCLFQLLQRGRVLTLIREGPWGCVGINDFMEQTLRGRLDRAARGRLFLGAPVLITRNDHARQLFNGDVGITVRSAGGGYRVVFQRGDSFVAYSPETLPGHELAFALTVHKSQGSEYDQVLLVLPPEGGRRLLSKEMIYTGITRARNLAVICATREALAVAIRRRVERESALLQLDRAANV
jgi:exodeoxyribonuclease V alpha subunit